MRHVGYIVALLWAIGTFALPQHDFTHSFSNGLKQRALPVGTCNSDTPCENGACCGSNKLCGYSPTECGTGCTSDCNAKAECGQYGTTGQQSCPLNVCCSQFGLKFFPKSQSPLADHLACRFCGSTSDFCDTGCQTGFGGCGPPPRPSCGGSKVGQRTIGSVPRMMERDF